MPLLGFKLQPVADLGGQRGRSPPPAWPRFLKIYPYIFIVGWHILYSLWRLWLCGMTIERAHFICWSVTAADIRLPCSISCYPQSPSLRRYCFSADRTYRLGLRGQRNDGSLLHAVADEGPVRNEGNFRELLRFRVLSGDEILKSHLDTAAANATYISKSPQTCW